MNPIIKIAYVTKSTGFLKTNFNTLASDRGKSQQEVSDKSTHILVRKLTAKEIQQRRKKGLCFNCDEKLSKYHKCKVKFIILLFENNE